MEEELSHRFIARLIGLLLAFESIMLLACCCVSMIYGESDLAAFIISFAVCLVTGVILLLCGQKKKTAPSRYEAYIVVALSWVFFSLFGMLPYLCGGYIPSITDAFFETMSGFTTTGATAFPVVEALPKSLLFWRSLTHWIGGMGIIFFTVAVLPALGVGEQKVFAAESTGVKIGKLHPRISTTAHWLWSLYFLLTVGCALAYYLCGMSVWDAVNHSLSTLSTGGFSTHTDSLGWFQSPMIEYVSVLFMWIASVNFSLTYLLIVKRRFGQVLGNTELRAYIAILLGATLVFAVSYFITFVDFSQFSLTHDGILNFLGSCEESFRTALFHAVSVQTTTGFTKHDFMAWPSICWMAVIFISICGGCSGSTSGGVKVVRIVFMLKMVGNEFTRILHPRAVLPTRLNGENVEDGVVRSAVTYLFLYAILLLLGTSFMLLLGFPALDAFGISVSSLSNIGPSLGYVVGPFGSWDVLPDAAVWLQSFLMLAGRLEIFSLLLPFIPTFWRDR